MEINRKKKKEKKEKNNKNVGGHYRNVEADPPCIITYFVYLCMPARVTVESHVIDIQWFGR